jgi:hypothetical protein
MAGTQNQAKGTPALKIIAESRLALNPFLE